MDKTVNSKTKQQLLLEMYSACRLCGARDGFRMPIIQNVLGLEPADDINFSQKVRDCIQIEVHPQDKMPPLICGLCADKIDDFYEFMQSCQRNVKHTRRMLGFPMETLTMNKATSPVRTRDSNSRATEALSQNEDSNEPLALNHVTRKGKPDSKSKNVKKEISSKQKRPPSPPPRATRSRKSSESSMDFTYLESVSLSNLKQQARKSSTAAPPPRSILKKGSTQKKESNVNQKEKRTSPVSVKLKRPREVTKPEVPAKRVRLPPPVARRPAPRRAPPPPPPPRAPPAPEHACRVCAHAFSSSQALANHVRVHTVGFTSLKLSCNACQQWFCSYDEAQAHHRWHRAKHKPYRCARCGARHASLALYTRHIEDGLCLPWEEVPDKQCPECWKTFPTDNLLSQHHCGGSDARPGGKCGKCKRFYSLLKNLKKHEASCTHKKKGGTIKVDPAVRARLKPARVRLARCDAPAGQDFGLDRSCVYPYSTPAVVKSELPKDSMVKIKAEIDEYEPEYVHWDSSDSEDEITVKNLSTLALKKIFSTKLLGKVPRKRRKLKVEKAFDSILNASDLETTLNRDINNIIDNLGDDDSIWDDKHKDGNQQGSDEESLLTNYVFLDDVAVDSKRNNVEDSNDSQSILDLNVEATRKIKDNVLSSDNSKNLNSDAVGSVRENDDEETSTHKEDKNNDKSCKNAVEESAQNNDMSKVRSDENIGESCENTVRYYDVGTDECGTRMETRTENDSEIEKSVIGSDNIDPSCKNILSNVNKVGSDEISSESETQKGDYDSEIGKSDKIHCDLKDASNILTNHSKSDSTKSDNFNENIGGNTKTDCVHVNIFHNLENKNNSVNIQDQNTDINLKSESTSNVTENDKIANNETKITNNDVEENNITEIANNDTELTNNDRESPNNDVTVKSNDDSPSKEIKISENCTDNKSSDEILNGLVEEKSNKLSFSHMNDISDSDLDDKKLMDALNEQIGENNSVSYTFNDELTKYRESNVKNENNTFNDNFNETCNSESKVINDNDRKNTSELTTQITELNEHNGAKYELSHPDDIVTGMNHFNDHERAINDVLIKNDVDIENNDSKIKVGDCEQDKISLQDLIPSKIDTNSMDLDSISDDEFDFDNC